MAPDARGPLASLILALLSSVLLALSFPTFDLGFLAWAALAPLLIALGGSRAARAFTLSYLFGILFLLVTFSWIFTVKGYTVLHHGLLALYLGFYFALFGMAFSYISAKWRPEAALMAAPCLWVALEYARSSLDFLALPWMLLAHTQYQFLPIVQTSALTGAWGVSFLIVAVNSATAAAILFLAPRLWEKAPRNVAPVTRRGAMATIGFASLVFSSALCYGFTAVSAPVEGKELRVSVVQGNIEKPGMWNRQHVERVMETYDHLTEIASREGPELIVWPETAAPGSIDMDKRLRDHIQSVVQKTQAHLLLGSSRHQKLLQDKTDALKYKNSAFLLSPGGERISIQSYDKIHLLPFGEYLPYKNIIPWGILGIPDMKGYLAGEEIKVFDIPQGRIAATICWENIFPDLVRQFVRKGARLIVNITAEGDFGSTASPYQFLSMSVMRAVENRVYVVRCANTGVSCFIDSRGRVVDRVRDEKGKDIFVAGVLTGPAILTEGATFYTRYGDWFVLLCAIISGMALVIAWRREVWQELREKDRAS